jgi:hypothetical protein
MYPNSNAISPIEVMEQGGIFPWPRLEISCNMGGPSSRSRREMIQSTLLGDLSKSSFWPLVLTVGLVFPEGASPVDLTWELLGKSGFESPEQLRTKFAIPQSILVCRPLQDPEHKFPRIGHGRKKEILKQALLLGLCGASFYDPVRPVLWTNQSLTRRLALYSTGEFYE